MAASDSAGAGAQATPAKFAKPAEPGSDDEDDNSWGVVAQIEQAGAAKAKASPAPKSSTVVNRFKKSGLKCPWCEASSKAGARGVVIFVSIGSILHAQGE